MASGGTKATFIDLLSWLVVAVTGAITLTQAFGLTGTWPVAVVQALTPYFGAVLVPIVLAALWRRQFLVVTVSAAVLFGVAVLGTPLAFPDDRPAPAPGSVGLDVAALNLWYQNTRVDEVDEVLADLDADVIVFTEYTPEHEASLLASPLSPEFVHRRGTSGPGRGGIVVWSRFPLRVGEFDSLRRGLDLTVAGPDGDVRILAMHLPTPSDDFNTWRRVLATAREIGRTAGESTLIIGDLNSSYWHPDFRRVLDAGFVDAHTAAGSGFSTSWPTNWRIPPFVRLDHALTTGDLVATSVDDFDVPGSDHRGLVVTVAPAR